MLDVLWQHVSARWTYVMGRDFVRPIKQSFMHIPSITVRQH